jgi:hypothetical protein
MPDPLPLEPDSLKAEPSSGVRPGALLDALHAAMAKYTLSDPPTSFSTRFAFMGHPLG